MAKEMNRTSELSCSGSMLIFGGVILIDRESRRHKYFGFQALALILWPNLQQFCFLIKSTLFVEHKGSGWWLVLFTKHQRLFWSLQSFSG